MLETSDGPFLLGKALTELDVRLFTTVVRFDPVYVRHFKVNVRRASWPFCSALTLRRDSWGDGLPATASVDAPSLPRRAGLPRDARLGPHQEQLLQEVRGRGRARTEAGSHLQSNPSGIVPIGPLPHVEDLPDAEAGSAPLQGWEGTPSA